MEQGNDDTHREPVDRVNDGDADTSPLRTLRTLLQDFQRAGLDGREFRGAPFWSWNDDLDPDELRRQIREMKRAGLGGHMMHARIGLVTPYLGEKWMECIRAAVEESAREGMEAWLYDEDCWPSGSAGGRVPAKGEAYRQKWIVAREIPPDNAPADISESNDRVIAAYAGEKKDGAWTAFRRVTGPAEIDAARGWPGAAFLLLSYDAGEYVDLLSPMVVRDFIREDYEVYRPVAGEEFGRAVPGIFTDEPQWRHIPWSADLPDFYRKLWDEEVFDILPSVLFGVGDARRARYRFWCAATRLYVDSFSRQIGEWCREANLLLTGHQMSEDSLSSQIRSIGAAMPHYAEMGMPGIDHLGRRIADPLLVKQVGSAGSQLGRRTLSEMFGCAGWNVGFEELKWIAEWQFALGVSFVCQHLSLYSLRGCRKRDYPPSLHYQQPWWDDYRLLNDRFARQLFLLTRGKRVVDLLLLHPIGSAWAVHDPFGGEAMEAMNRRFVGISRFLLSIHRDHDYGDEFLLERLGSVEEGRLRVGEAAYSTVLLPPLVTIRRETAELLRAARAAGVKLVQIGESPERIDGEAGAGAGAFREWLREAAASCPDDDPDALETVLFTLEAPRIQVTEEGGGHAESILIHQREADGKQILFLANTDREKPVRADVALTGEGAVSEWDPDTGEATPLSVRRAMGSMAFRLDFEPMGSRLVVVDPAVSPLTGAAIRPIEVGAFYGEEEWEMTLLSPNSLTLDTARYRTGDGDWSEPSNVLHIQRDLAKRAEDVEVSLEFLFESRLSAPPDELHLVMERPEDHAIAINGEPVEPRDGGWWTDISFRKIPIAPHVRAGENRITLTRRFGGDPETARLLAEGKIHESEGNRLKFGSEIEAVYLIGPFGVSADPGAAPIEPEPNGSFRHHGPFALVDLPKRARSGDLTVQGLPFFRGTVALEQEIWLPERPGDDIRAVLMLDPPDAVVARVVVNGVEAGARAWRPYRFDVTDLLSDTEATRLRIELTNSCRNLLGPHHHVDGELHSVGPDSFTGRRGWTDRRGAPESTWKDGYNLVPFGIAGDVILLFEAVG